MIETDYGKFDNKKWEDICQICFKRKYDDECYFEILATPGDYGIEGFTRTGKAFQCYCPDKEYSAKELYEKQRDKITKDLKKLKKYETQIKKKIGKTKITRWYFVTPSYTKNEIVDHCTKMMLEVKKWNLSIINNNDFEVVLYDVQSLLPFFHIALSGSTQKFRIGAQKDAIDLQKIFSYKDTDGFLVVNAKRKHTKRIVQHGISENQVDSLTDKTIRHFLIGKDILEKWEKVLPLEYEKFRELIEKETEEIEDRSLFPSSDFNRDYREVKNEIANLINENFASLESVMRKDLTNYVIADWLLRCPLNFVEERNK